MVKFIIQGRLQCATFSKWPEKKPASTGDQTASTASEGSACRSSSAWSWSPTSTWQSRWRRSSSPNDPNVSIFFCCLHWKEITVNSIQKK